MMLFQRDTYKIFVPAIEILCLIAVIINALVLVAYARLGDARLTPTLRLNLGLGL
jgi:hypothetical protein